MVVIQVSFEGLELREYGLRVEMECFDGVLFVILQSLEEGFVVFLDFLLTFPLNIIDFCLEVCDIDLCLVEFGLYDFHGVNKSSEFF